jgi:hypothetical protein
VSELGTRIEHLRKRHGEATPARRSQTCTHEEQGEGRSL